MRIHFLEHVPFERPAYLLQWAAARRHTVGATRFYEPGRAAELPELAAVDLLVAMGGPMGVSDERRYPWLSEEKRLLRAAIEGGKRVFGVCLGAQLIASALGARVRRNEEREIGWFPIELTEQARASGPFAGFPERLTVFHWHGDTFELPEGALLAATSEACRNQAFVLDGRVVGLQFHLEMTPLSVARLLSHSGADIEQARFIQQPDGAGFPVDRSAFDANHALLDRLLDRLLGSEA